MFEHKWYYIIEAEMDESSYVVPYVVLVIYMYGYVLKRGDSGNLQHMAPQDFAHIIFVLQFINTCFHSISQLL